MKFKIVCVLLLAGLLSCDNTKNDVDESPVAGQLEGTWQLRSATIIENDDTTVTEYSKRQSMIKIINKTHFAFLNHDLTKGKDSTALFAAGGGVYTLAGDQYTEYLEYCSAREWEGNTFQFTVKVSGDTLTQSGTEKVENLGIERMNIEIYTRVED